MMPPLPQTFRSRVDRWLVLTICGVILVGLGPAIFVMAREPVALFVVMISLLGIVLLGVLCAVPTTYTITADTLVIRFGLFRIRVPLDAIDRAYPTRNIGGSPAWSLDRLGVHYRVAGRRRLVLISPVRKAEFLDLLRQRADLERAGDDLIARPRHAGERDPRRA